MRRIPVSIDGRRKLWNTRFAEDIANSLCRLSIQCESSYNTGTPNGCAVVGNEREEPLLCAFHPAARIEENGTDLEGRWDRTV